MKSFVALLFIVTCFTSLDAVEKADVTSINSRIQLIPSQDKKILERFFKRLFCHADFSYALLGDKPMGSIDYNLNLLSFPQFYKEPEKHLFLMALDEKGWSVWEKYKDLFPMKKYVFIKVKHDDCFGFLLINKEKTRTIIQQNLSLFQCLSGKKDHPQMIMEKLCQGQFNYSYIHDSNLASYYNVFGLLYGYGKENIQAYMTRERLIETLRSLPIDIARLPSEVVDCLEIGGNLNPNKKSEYKGYIEVTSLVFELKNLINKNHLIKGTKKNHPFLPIKKTWFFGSEEYSETKIMLKNWDDVSASMLEIYESENFLETILVRLTS